MWYCKRCLLWVAAVLALLILRTHETAWRGWQHVTVYPSQNFKTTPGYGLTSNEYFNSLYLLKDADINLKPNIYKNTNNISAIFFIIDSNDNTLNSSVKYYYYRYLMQVTRSFSCFDTEPGRHDLFNHNVIRRKCMLTRCIDIFLLYRYCTGVTRDGLLFFCIVYLNSDISLRFSVPYIYSEYKSKYPAKYFMKK